MITLFFFNHVDIFLKIFKNFRNFRNFRNLGRDEKKEKFPDFSRKFNFPGSPENVPADQKKGLNISVCYGKTLFFRGETNYFAKTRSKTQYFGEISSKKPAEKTRFAFKNSDFGRVFRAPIWVPI